MTMLRNLGWWPYLLPIVNSSNRGSTRNSNGSDDIQYRYPDEHDWVVIVIMVAAAAAVVVVVVMTTGTRMRMVLQCWGFNCHENDNQRRTSTFFSRMSAASYSSRLNADMYFS